MLRSSDWATFVAEAVPNCKTRHWPALAPNLAAADTAAGLPRSTEGRSATKLLNWVTEAICAGVGLAIEPANSPAKFAAFEVVILSRLCSAPPSPGNGNCNWAWADDTETAAASAITQWPKAQKPDVKGRPDMRREAKDRRIIRANPKLKATQWNNSKSSAYTPQESGMPLPGQMGHRHLIGS